MNEKRDKTVIVTGGASGIGLEVASSLLQVGYNVLVVDNNQLLIDTALENISRDKLNSFFTLNADLKDWNSGAKIMDFCIRNKLNAFALINNIGFRSNEDFITENQVSWNNSISALVQSAFTVSRNFIIENLYDKHLYIINVGSITSRLISDQSPAYHVAKSALEGLTRYLAVQAPKIRKNTSINYLALGFIVQKRHTEKFYAIKNESYMQSAINYLPNQIPGNDADVANIINFLISGSADFINGVCINLDGGATLREQFSLIWPKNVT